MTAIEKLQAKVEELSAKLSAFLSGTPAPKAEGQENPEPKAEGQEPVGVITAELKASIEAAISEVTEIKGTLETAVAEANTAKTEAEKAKTDFEAKSAQLEKDFEARVSTEAAKLVAEAGGKPLAKAQDNPAPAAEQKPVDEATGINRVAAALAKRKAA